MSNDKTKATVHVDPIKVDPQNPAASTVALIPRIPVKVRTKSAHGIPSVSSAAYRDAVLLVGTGCLEVIDSEGKRVWVPVSDFIWMRPDLG